MSVTPQVYDFTTFEMSRLGFNDPSKTSGGSYMGKSYYTVENQKVAPFYIQLPKMKCSNLSLTHPDSRNYIEFELASNHLELYEFMAELDDRNITLAYRNSTVWFQQNLTMDTIDDFYRPIIKPKRGNKPPSFKIRIPTQKGNILAHTYNSERQMVDLRSVHPQDELSIIVQIVGLRFLKQQFLCELHLIQAKHYPVSTEIPSNYLFLDADREKKLSVSASLDTTHIPVSLEDLQSSDLLDTDMNIEEIAITDNDTDDEDVLDKITEINTPKSELETPKSELETQENDDNLDQTTDILEKNVVELKDDIVSSNDTTEIATIEDSLETGTSESPNTEIETETIEDNTTTETETATVEKNATEIIESMDDQTKEDPNTTVTQDDSVVDNSVDDTMDTNTEESTPADVNTEIQMENITDDKTNLLDIETTNKDDLTNLESIKDSPSDNDLLGELNVENSTHVEYAKVDNKNPELIEVDLLPTEEVTLVKEEEPMKEVITLKSNYSEDIESIQNEIKDLQAKMAEKNEELQLLQEQQKQPDFEFIEE